jgi:hypothetical protein
VKAIEFWDRVEKGADCWLWTGAKNSLGYGHLLYDGRDWYAHRLAWVLVNGPIPEGMNCLHKCDVPLCVNPAHLFLGSLSDNTQDMMRKGRALFQTNPERIAYGEADGNSKLTADQVQEIRRLRTEEGLSQRVLGKMFGVSHINIGFIVRGETWQRV